MIYELQNIIDQYEITGLIDFDYIKLIELQEKLLNDLSPKKRALALKNIIERNYNRDKLTIWQIKDRINELVPKIKPKKFYLYHSRRRW